jgi:glycosyltransferase involved in cell wall biosynthesis
VAVLAHSAPPTPTPAPFAERGGLLFVGPVEPALDPNGDSLRWFLQQVTPAFAAPRPALTIVGRGSGPGSWLAPLLGPDDAGLGSVDDLAPHYARARVFVAPTRFAAGIPLKVIDAARHGVPVVATRLLAGQLGWKPGVELLAEDDPARFAAAVAMLHDDPALWARLREAALAAVVRDFDPGRFAATVRAVARGQPMEPAGRVLH